MAWASVDLTGPRGDKGPPGTDADISALLKRLAEVEAKLDAAIKAASTPKIASLVPAEHVEQESFPLEVHGERFLDGAVVKISGAANILYPVTSTAFKSSTLLLAQVPTGYGAGDRVVRVANPGGIESENDFPFKFTKPSNPPYIERIEPDHHVEGGSFPMAIIGHSFNEDATVYVGGAAQKTTHRAQNRLDATIQGDLDPHEYAISVREAGEDDSNAKTLTITAKHKSAPHIRNISPTYHVERDSFKMTVTGENFEDGAKAQLFDDDGWSSTADRTTVSSSTEIHAMFGDRYNANTHSVRVVNPDGQFSNALTFRLTQAHHEEPPPKRGPVIDRISPESTTDTTFRLHVYGHNFDDGGATIYVGGSACRTQGDGTTHLWTDLEDWPTGGYYVVVKNPDGQQSEGKDLHVGKEHHEEPKAPAPSLEAIVPESVAAAQPFSLIVMGSNFVRGCKCQIEVDTDNWASLHTDWDSSTKVFVKVDRVENVWDKPQVRSIRVQNPDGQGSNKKQITFKSGMPAIHSIQPDHVAPWNQTDITLKGENLREGGHLVFHWDDQGKTYNSVDTYMPHFSYVKKYLPTTIVFRMTAIDKRIGIQYRDPDGTSNSDSVYLYPG